MGYVPAFVVQGFAGPGTMAPTVRLLNLNYNFIGDVGPLNGPVRLKQLMLIGSRLRSPKTFLKALRNMPNIKMVDIRYDWVFSLGASWGFTIPAFLSE